MKTFTHFTTPRSLLLTLAGLGFATAPLRADDDHHAYDHARAHAESHHAAYDRDHAAAAFHRAVESGHPAAIFHAIRDRVHASQASRSAHAADHHANGGHSYYSSGGRSYSGGHGHGYDE